MLSDLWFARDSSGQLYFNLHAPNEGPHSNPMKIKSVSDAFAWAKNFNYKVVQVGIADIEMLRI